MMFSYICAAMSVKLFNFLALFAYINCLCYQDGPYHGQYDRGLLDGDPLIEIVLDDLLDFPLNDAANESDFHYEKYRPNFGAFSLAQLLPKQLVASLTQLPLLLSTPMKSAFGSKLKCLPGYYLYLFRLKPF
ncbi:hypothetical protein SAMN05421747_10533 [Parapedobacter composti]|uniref:Uncharacterized protein n=2 Tax=Parapedobacter composti TaxID=623281 RepID=A0A1I1GXF3_9SPHI|nr:hypothetical protein SAMN05421747_10533 [Parapedobacter composti]